MADDSSKVKDEIPDDTEILQVHIQATDQEYEQVCGYRVRITEGEASSVKDKRNIILSRGGDHTTHDGGPWSLYGAGPLQRAVLQDEARGLGYFLYACEVNGIPQAEVTDTLGDELEPFYDDQNSLTQTDRQVRLLDYADHRIEGGDWMAAKYIDGDYPGEWRTTGLTESAFDVYEDILRHADRHPATCYYSAQMAAKLHQDNHRVEYYEGLALPLQAAQTIRHAWVEIDGRVAEVTWPWHMGRDSKAVYLGHKFDKDEVVATRERREEELGMNGPVAATDDELRQVTEGMRLE